MPVYLGLDIGSTQARYAITGTTVAMEIRGSPGGAMAIEAYEAGISSFSLRVQLKTEAAEAKSASKPATSPAISSPTIL